MTICRHYLKALSADEQADEDLESKLQLEDALVLLLIPFFNRISKDVERDGVVSSERFSELDQILKNHYRETSNSFSMNLIERLKLNRNTGLGRAAREAADNLDVSYFRFLDNIQSESQFLIDQSLAAKANDHAAIILNTTENRLNSAKSRVQNESETELSRQEINEQSALILNAQAEGRSKTIATTETQQVSETLKMQEARDFNSALIGAGVIASVQKMWKDRDDDKVRAWHREADLQKQFIGQPYTVNGQSLMHPGDRSMGASLNNIVNCRCSSIILL